MIRIICILVLLSTGGNLFASDRWLFSVTKDKMTNEESYYVVSPRTKSDNIGMLYSSLESSLAMYCDATNFSYYDPALKKKVKQKGATYNPYFYFTISPNLAHTTTEDGYNTGRARIKLDDALYYVRFIQYWGSKYIYIKDLMDDFDGADYITPEDFQKRLKETKSILLELAWYGEGNVYFKYSMNGAMQEIETFKNRCQKEYGVVPEAFLKPTDKSLKKKIRDDFTYFKSGMRKKIQTALVDYGYDGKIDGLFGEGSFLAIKSFLEKEKITHYRKGILWKLAFYSEK